MQRCKRIPSSIIVSWHSQMSRARSPTLHLLENILYKTRCWRLNSVGKRRSVLLHNVYISLKCLGSQPCYDMDSSNRRRSSQMMRIFRHISDSSSVPFTVHTGSFMVITALFTDYKTKGHYHSDIGHCYVLRK